MGALNLVIFDVDGTLVDSQNGIVAAMADAFGAVGRDGPPRDEVLSIVGLSLPQAFARLAPWADDGEAARMADAYREAYFRNRAAGKHIAPLYPGARAALDELAGRAGVILGIATGKSRRGLDAVLDLHGLTGMFQTTQVSDHHPSKPHPAMVQAAMAEVGVACADTVVLGDTSYDMEMARSAGARGLGAAWGYHSAKRLADAGAVGVLTGYCDLFPALDRIWGGE